MGNSNSAQADFLEFLAHAANDPPDPNAPLPLGNQPRVIYGVTIPFLVRVDDLDGRVASRGLTR
jgi:hypothetical protein